MRGHANSYAISYNGPREERWLPRHIIAAQTRHVSSWEILDATRQALPNGRSGRYPARKRAGYGSFNMVGWTEVDAREGKQGKIAAPAAIVSRRHVDVHSPPSPPSTLRPQGGDDLRQGGAWNTRTAAAKRQKAVGGGRALMIEVLPSIEYRRQPRSFASQAVSKDRHGTQVTSR